MKVWVWWPGFAGLAGECENEKTKAAVTHKPQNRSRFVVRPSHCFFFSSLYVLHAFMLKGLPRAERRNEGLLAITAYRFRPSMGSKVSWASG